MSFFHGLKYYRERTRDLEKTLEELEYNEYAVTRTRMEIELEDLSNKRKRLIEENARLESKLQETRQQYAAEIPSIYVQDTPIDDDPIDEECLGANPRDPNWERKNMSFKLYREANESIETFKTILIVIMAFLHIANLVNFWPFILQYIANLWHLISQYLSNMLPF